MNLFTTLSRSFSAIPLLLVVLATQAKDAVRPPHRFEENKGQFRQMNGGPADFVRYRLVHNDVSIFLLDNGIAYQFTREHLPEGYAALAEEVRFDPTEQEALDALRKDIMTETFRMDMVLEGASTQRSVTAEGRSTDHAHYYTHKARDVHSFERITYHEVYPGIDWVIYGTEEGVKYDFVVHPGADPDKIRLRFKHHEELSLDGNGGLFHGNRLGSFTEGRPVSYQGARTVPTRFVLDGDLLRFSVDGYDRSRTLVIDPARIWASYYGGAGDEDGRSCAVDANGNVFLAGTTPSPAAIAAGGHQTSYGGGDSDAFLVKFNAEGVRQWATYYGGDTLDTGLACAVAADGSVYLSGTTFSTSGISSNGHQGAFGGAGFSDAYLVKFGADGSRIWATYYGGAQGDQGNSVSVDVSGNVLLAGTTRSPSAIAEGGFQNTYAGGQAGDAFLVKFNAAGTRLWGTYFGAAGSDEGFKCTSASDGAVFLTGLTRSPSGIATTDAHQTTIDGATFGDAFLVKYDAAGTRLWSTYYGGMNNDYAHGLATSSDGSVYLAGTTFSSGSISANGHQNTFGYGGTDAFLAKFNTDGTRAWGTYYGGANGDYAFGCAVDATGNVYLAGGTGSSTAIASNGYQNTFGGTSVFMADAFLAKFTGGGVRVWGTYYGADAAEWANDCAVSTAGHVLIIGITNSTSAMAAGGHSNTLGGGNDAFLAMFTSTDGTAVNEVTRQGVLRISPNPGNGAELRLDLGAIDPHRGPLLLEFLDATGRLMNTHQIPSGAERFIIPIDPALSSGTYVVRVVAGGRAFTERVVIQR